MQSKQRGFGIIQVVLLVVLAGMIVSIGWYVWSNRNAGGSSIPNDPVVSKKDVSDKNSKDELVAKKYTLKTHTSKLSNFSVLVPSEIHDQYGGCKKEADSYRPNSDWVPTKVIESGESVYITVEYFYNLEEDSISSTGVTNFASCKKVTNTLAITEDNENSATPEYVNFESLELNVGSVSNDAQINSFLSRNIWENYKLDQLVDVTGKEWKEVKLSLINPQESAGQGKTVIRYYPSRNKIIAWNIGQYNHYLDPAPAGDDNVDYMNQMIDSFKFN